MASYVPVTLIYMEIKKYQLTTKNYTTIGMTKNCKVLKVFENHNMYHVWIYHDNDSGYDLKGHHFYIVDDGKVPEVVENLRFIDSVMTTTQGAKHIFCTKMT